MKERLFAILFLTATFQTFGQTDFLKSYKTADSLVASKNYFDAYSIFKEIEPEIDNNDTLYSYVLWYYTTTTTQLEAQNAMAERWESAVKFGLEALTLIEKGKSLFDESFASSEYWMHKNLVVAYNGLGQIENAQKHKEFLYKAYKKKELPDGINEYFNFSFFKWKDKNIWGYEWYPELPTNRSSSSFTKDVYYVYSTNPDGTDKDQLFRFHVLMFHQDTKNPKFDYLLEIQQESESELISGSYYRYTYQEKIDYIKLKKDVIEILENNIQPDSRRTIPKRSN